MKNFGGLLCQFLVALASASLVVSASTGTTTKEHKKKLLDKLRAALNTSDGDIPVAVIPSAEDLAKLESAEEKVEEAPALTKEEIGVVTAQSSDTDSTKPENALVGTDFFARFRSVVKRVLEMIGLRRRKDGRQSRLIAFENNDLDRVPAYQEEVRTTVGAVLGQKECVQKVACVSGSYLKGVKGKQLIFALLDVFSPTAWKDTVRIAKQSAIFNESCNYKCLED